jgi:hypothetical protein
MCSMNHETKFAVAVHSPRIATVAAGVLVKLWHRCTIVQVYTLLFDLLIPQNIKLCA